LSSVCCCFFAFLTFFFGAVVALAPDGVDVLALGAGAVVCGASGGTAYTAVGTARAIASVAAESIEMGRMGVSRVGLCRTAPAYAEELRFRGANLPLAGM
jgi:predicted lipase